MQLSLRLSAIADMVTTGNRLVDVGCDHGYLPVYPDTAEKFHQPLQWMYEKALFQGEGAYPAVWSGGDIQTRLSDGLENLKAGSGDTLVIAGMGGSFLWKEFSRLASL